jgi:hypothetical protein
MHAKQKIIMKILGIQVLRGPNIWSISRKKLIQMRLDLEDLEQKPTNLIPGFRERIEQLIPSLYRRTGAQKPLQVGFCRVWKKELGWDM